MFCLYQLSLLLLASFPSSDICDDDEADKTDVDEAFRFCCLLILFSKMSTMMPLLLEVLDWRSCGVPIQLEMRRLGVIKEEFMLLDLANIRSSIATFLHGG